MTTNKKIVKSYPIKLKRPNTWKISEHQAIVTHDASKCAGRHCCIHNPSDHHMRSWTMHWRDDLGVMERLCPEHGVGHPDPDSAEFNRSADRDYLNVHGCCGCCKQYRVIDIDAVATDTKSKEPLALENGD
jgi:hypothetical protein